MGMGSPAPAAAPPPVAAVAAGAAVVGSVAAGAVVGDDAPAPDAAGAEGAAGVVAQAVNTADTHTAVAMARFETLQIHILTSRIGLITYGCNDAMVQCDFSQWGGGVNRSDQGTNAFPQPLLIIARRGKALPVSRRLRVG